jgi:ABC-2 type transport system permease protein
MAVSAPAAVPGFFTHLRLLWGLRLDIALNRDGKRRGYLTVLGYLFSTAPGWGLALGAYQLLGIPAIAQSDVWPDFLLRLLCFVTSAVWATWPLLSAGVDDHSELSRYVSFPISSMRLMWASMVAGLFEPRSLVFYAPLLGVTAAYLKLRVSLSLTSVVLAALAWVAFAFFNAALSRLALHLVLNLLKQKRSGQLLGGFFVLFLAGASFIPPIDTSWLFMLNGDVAAVPDTVITDATIALGRFPTGWYAHTLRSLGFGNPWNAAKYVVWVLVLTGLVVALSYRALLRFYRQSGAAGAQGGRARQANPFASTRSLFVTLMVREAIDLWHNPRARLLASVPFLLAILLKLLSGRDLFVFFLGASADAWVMGGLCVYGTIVIASTFSQNAFGYDGHGFAAFVASPISLGQVLKAKNAVHALAAAGLASLAAIFYRVYFGTGSALDLLCTLLGVALVIPTLLVVGNGLSLYFPVKFHADLKRRDRLPLLASVLGVAGVFWATTPWAAVLRATGKEGMRWESAAWLAAAVLCAWGLYAALLPATLVALDRRRESVLKAVTRE